MKKLIYGFLALFTITSITPMVSMVDANNNVPTFSMNRGTNDDEWNAGFSGDDATTGMFLNGGARGVGGNSGMQGAKLLDSIKTFINWALGMLATVALVLCLWGGFQMMTAGGDQGKYDGGVAILKKAAIGLVVIGGSWMLVSIVMWLIGKVSA